MSKFAFNCPGCGEEISCDSSYIGYKAECPYCGTKFLVPDNSALSTEVKYEKSVETKRIKRSMLFLSAIGFLCATVVGLIITVACLVPSRGAVAKVDSGDALKMCVTISCVGGSGSGFIVKQGGQLRVVTCRHVVEDEPVVVVKDLNGNQYGVKQISISKDRDVAVIDLITPASNASYFKIARDVSVIGLNAELACYGDSEGTGVIVPCYGRLIGIGPSSVETDAPFVPGNSGGPVVSKSTHEVVGVASVLTRINEGNKWVKGTRFENQTRHFAVRIDNLRWNDLEKTDAGLVREDDLARINEIAAESLKNGEIDKAIALYSYAANKDDANAINALGEFFVVRNNKGDIEDAVKLFKKASKNGLSEGKINLGLCYLYGRGVRKDSGEAFASFKEASVAGNPYATYLMGVCFRDGQGVEKNIAEAVRCFEAASSRGEMHAQNALGDFYWEGLGVKKDWEKAYELFKLSAEQKYAEAEWNMGVCYTSAVGVNKDMIVAAQWYLKSAEHGYARAQKKMGDLYYRGEGVVKDYDKMFYWYSKAAEQGDPGAEAELGLAYIYGNGVSRDLVKAFFWLERAANDGYVPAINEVGNCFYNGSGVRKDVREAVAWYKQAANKGNKLAMKNLGYLYKNGDGVERNYDTALYWMEQYGDKNEIENLKIDAGNYYYDQNRDMAALWWSRTYDKRYWNCAGVIYYNTGRYSEAYKWFSKAAGSPYGKRLEGNEWAMLNLGRCYLYGRGVEQNTYIAISCFDKVVYSSQNSEIMQAARKLRSEAQSR